MLTPPFAWVPWHPRSAMSLAICLLRLLWACSRMGLLGVGVGIRGGRQCRQWVAALAAARCRVLDLRCVVGAQLRHSPRLRAHLPPLFTPQGHPAHRARVQHRLVVPAGKHPAGKHIYNFEFILCGWPPPWPSVSVISVRSLKLIVSSKGSAMSRSAHGVSSRA